MTSNGDASVGDDEAVPVERAPSDGERRPGTGPTFERDETVSGVLEFLNDGLDNTILDDWRVVGVVDQVRGCLLVNAVGCFDNVGVLHVFELDALLEYVIVDGDGISGDLGGGHIAIVDIWTGLDVSIETFSRLLIEGLL